VSRRLVVVLFLDLVGWTRLAESVDPEPLQLLLERYYEICCNAVEEHGGVVEKFIGDAVMAVFGATTSQEDDAPRALRTAFQIRADVGELRTPGATPLPVEVHCGIAAGEALVTHSARAGIRVVGDVVNLAARLQSKAGAGEILVNEITAHLARRHFAMAAVEPLTLKGKAEPVPAMLATGPVAADRIDDGLRMVDREPERARLRAAYERVTRERRAGVVAVLGPPGIGKTRLVREVIDELRAAATPPTAVIGGCPSYGPNGSYVALIQVLDELARQAPGCQDLVRANSRVAAVLASLHDASVARRDDGAGPGPGVEEVSWATRELFAAAATRPLVVVWDSLEWAGHTLLRLIGDLMDSLRDTPLLMVCVARPELADLDVAWMRGLADRDVLDVGALAPDDSARMVVSLATGGALVENSAVEVLAHDLDLVDRVTIYSAGNPLFIRLMVESVTPGRPLDEVPASITAMVGAMLDRLPVPAQRLLGAASVIGPAFTTGQLALLDETAPAAGLDVLVERRLIRGDGEPGGYRFVQQPVHEVAYGRLEKEQRLAWHRRLAERDVSPAFHFEAAVRLLTDLRPDDAELPRLAGNAAQGLLREGTAALRQRDVVAAIGLLDRALRLAPAGPDRWRSVAAIRLSDALMLSGDIGRALEVVTELARPGPDGRVERPCLVQQQVLAVRLGRVGEVAVDNLLVELDRDPDDRLARCRLEQLRMLLHLGSGLFGAAERAALAALEHARAIDDTYEEDRLLAALCEVRQWSPTSVVAKLAGCAELAERFAGDRYLLVPVLATRARCLALIGDPAGARAALAEAAAGVEQLRLTMGQVLIDQAAGLICSLDGAHAEAERHFRAAADALDLAGYAPVALTLLVQAARERLRRDPTAATEIGALLDRRAEMDVRGRLLCMSAAVRLAATVLPGAVPAGVDGGLRGDVLALLDNTDDPCLRGDVYFDLAQAHRLLGSHADATAMAGAAIDCYSAVGATKPLRTVQVWM
jgi:class 3 adenylate cyclase/tetratricopeptide (TPR) repeat protein